MALSLSQSAPIHYNLRLSLPRSNARSIEPTAHSLNRLSARSVAAITDPGRHADGARTCWYRRREPSHGCSCTAIREPNENGPGDLADGPPELVGRKAAVYREALTAGTDPRALRMQTTAPTFAVAAAEVIESQKPAWRNAKHAKQWETTIAEYCGSMRDLRVDEVEAEDVVKVLKPIWQRIPETAARLRMRIERILDYARAKGWRTGHCRRCQRCYLLPDSLLQCVTTRHKAMPQDVPASSRALSTGRRIGFCHGLGDLHPDGGPVR